MWINDNLAQLQYMTIKNEVLQPLIGSKLYKLKDRKCIKHANCQVGKLSQIEY